MFVNQINNLNIYSNCGLKTIFKPQLNLKQQLKSDTVSFSSKMPESPLNLAEELFKNFESADWQKFRKCSTKDTEIRVYNHPIYGKIKVGLTIRPGKDNISTFESYKVRAFMEIQHNKQRFSVSNRDCYLFKLAEKVTGESSFKRLKTHIDKEKDLSLKKFNKMCENLAPEDDYNPRKPRHPELVKCYKL